MRVPRPAPPASPWPTAPTASTRTALTAATQTRTTPTRTERARTTPTRTTAAIATATAALFAAAWIPAADAAPSAVRRCGTIAVPSTQARAAVSLRGTTLPCTTVQRVVREAYRRSVLIGDTRPFTLRDAGRTYRCRYTPSSGGMVCESRGRRLRGTI